MAVYELLKVAFLGLAATGFGALLKALPWPKTWAKRKPLGCASCVGGWSSLLVYALAVFTDHYQWDGVVCFALDWMVMTGISAWMLSMTGMFATITLEDL